MAGAVAGVAACLAAVAATYGAFTRRAQRVYQDALASSNATAEEGFSLARLVRAFGTEGATSARYDGTLATLRRISIRQVRWRGQQGGRCRSRAPAGRLQEGQGCGKQGGRGCINRPLLLVPTTCPPGCTQGVAYALYVLNNNFL